MLFSCTLKNGIVYVPTTVKTEAGFYMQQESVIVLPVANTDGLHRAFQEAMEKGNQIVPTPKWNAYPPPILPKYAGAKNWSAFMKGASEWSITEKDGKYKILSYRRDPEGSEGWVEDKDHKIEFAPGTTREQVIERIIQIIQSAVGRK
jgi:hypothetical protein